MSKRNKARSYITTFDVVIPYTSIPHDVDPKAIDYFLSNFPNGLHPQFRKPFAIEATDFLLRNTSTFYSNYYLQTQGTVMV